MTLSSPVAKSKSLKSRVHLPVLSNRRSYISYRSHRAGVRTDKIEPFVESCGFDHVVRNPKG